MSKRKIAAILAGTSAVGIINSGTSVAFASEREKKLELQTSGEEVQATPTPRSYTSRGTKYLGTFTERDYTNTNYNSSRHDTSSGPKYKYWFGTSHTTPYESRLMITGVMALRDSSGEYDIELMNNGNRLLNNSSVYEEFDLSPYYNNWVVSSGYKYFVMDISSGTLGGQVTVSGFQTIDGKLYYFNEDEESSQYCRLYNTAGWADNLGGYTARFYVNSDGSLATGTKNIGGVNYVFDSLGRLQGREISLSLSPTTVTINEGEAYNLKTGLTSRDGDGNDANSRVSINSGGFNESSAKAGRYTITYTLSTAGQTKTATRTIIVKGKPTFSGLDDVTINEGTKFDPLQGVSANDPDDGDITLTTSNVSYNNDFDPNNPKPGNYVATYTVRDNDGNTVTANRNITVKGLPKISGLTDVEIQSGEEFNPLAGVTVTDHEDVEITLKESDVTYTNDFNPKAPRVGAYVATYTAKDSDNNIVTGTRNITVTKRSDNAPTINGAEAKTIAKGVDFNPLADVTATDIEDKTENIKLTVETPENFDVNTEDEYLFIYRAEDLDGNVTEVPRIITVKEMVDSNFVRGAWSGESLIFEGKFDILGRTDDNNATKKLVIKDSSNGVVLETDLTNIADNDNTGYRKTIGKTIFDQLKGSGKYNLFIKTTVGEQEYELPITQNDIVNKAYVNNINDLEEKEFGTYKIKFMSDSSSNQVQIQKTNLADTEKPVINAPEISVVRGTAGFDLKQNVTITDNVDSQETLLGKLVIDEGNFDINQAGTYEVTYKVTDTAGNESETVTRTVTVTPKTTTKPTISGANNVSIVQGTDFDESAGVTARAEDGEDLTLRIQISGTVDENQVGEQTITYTVTDRDNNTTTATRRVTVTQKPAANKLPTINAPMRHEIYVGDNFDPLAIATAVDPEDGPITLTEANIVFNKVNTQKPGEYEVKYQVIDKDGGRRSKVITVVVKERPATSVKPTITFPEKTVIQVGESFDPIKDVTATDYRGQSITIEKKHVSWNKVDTSKPGNYQVKYTVTDIYGNTKIAYRTVTVEGQAITSKKPTIEYASNVVQTGTVFDPLAGVTAKDYKGNIINLDKSNVSWNKVNTNTPGTYQVKYTVIDSEGNRQIFYRDVTVQGTAVKPPATDKKPVISFKDNLEINVGDVFDPLAGVTATDYKGQNIVLTKDNIDWNKVNTKQAGTYQVKYVVRDAEGNQKIAYRTVIVKGYTGLKGSASLQSVTIDKTTNTLRIIGNVDSLIHVENDKEVNVSNIASDVKYYLVAKDSNGNEIFKNYLVRMNNGGSNSGFKANNLSNEELNKIQEGNDVTLSLVVETLGAKGELTLNSGSLSSSVEIVDAGRNVKYTAYSDGNKVKISKSKNTVTLSESEKVEVEANNTEAIEEAPKSEEVIEENTIVEEAIEEVVTEENAVVEDAIEEVVTEENAVVEEAIEEINLEVISDEEILELESELLLEGDLVIE